MGVRLPALVPKVLDAGGRSTYSGGRGKRDHALVGIATPPKSLAPTIQQIEHAIREQRQLRRRSARSALQLADRLLDQLELRLLADRRDVPVSLFHAIDTVRRAASGAGVDHASLETDCGVPRLMNDVYDLEAKLLRRLH